MLALLLAAGAALAHPVARPAQPARSIDQRVALLEARQLLESQALWGLQAAMPGDALKALSDLDLHLARDQEQEERVKLLQGQVQLLESRLASIELLLQDRTLGEGGPTRVAPAAAAIAAAVPAPVPVVSAPLVLHGKKPAKKVQARAKPGQKAPGTRVAER